MLKIKDISLNNKYTKWYLNLVNRSPKLKPKNGYYEKHHIVPRSIVKDDSLDNVCFLTPREHFICHSLLPKMLKDKSHVYLMLCALAYFSNNSKRKLKYTSRQIAMIREANSIASSKRNKGNNYYLHRDDKDPKLRELKSRNASKSKWVNNGVTQHFTANYEYYLNNGFKPGRLKFSDEWKAKIVTNLTGEQQKGVPKKSSSKAKMSESAKKRSKDLVTLHVNAMNKKITCHHCNISTTAGNYTRWHGNKCKLAPKITDQQ